MNSGATADRVYDAVKEQILSGKLCPGSRLEPAAFAQDLGSSATPVRDALHRLIGENLVDARSGEGFYMPQLTAPDLEDLYQWNGQVLLLMLHHAVGPPPQMPTIRDRSIPAAERAAGLFARIADRSANLEHRRIVAHLSDRLHAARSHEAAVLGDLDPELSVMIDAIPSSSTKPLARLIATYHRRRWRAASDIVRSVYRAEQD